MSRRLWLLLLSAAAVCCLYGWRSSSHSHQPEPNLASLQQLLVAGPLDGCPRRMQRLYPYLLLMVKEACHLKDDFAGGLPAKIHQILDQPAEPS
jgi:hypothetical protein